MNQPAQEKTRRVRDQSSARCFARPAASPSAKPVAYQVGP